MENAHFGMIGLGTMGRNFLLNVAENGFSCVGYDLDAEKRSLLLEEGGAFNIESADSANEFVSKLARPRIVMLLVPAGAIVDSVINDLLPHLENDDLVIDGGNSHFLDTERREAYLIEKGIGFLGVGVSGGEEGARRGPSIMPGGNPLFYERVRPILEAVSAKVNGEPCVAYMGTGSAGHFVKMVHNGIEYGLMQILAETYDFMLRVLKMDYRQMSETFAHWNNTELNSFLVEVTQEVLAKIDADTGKPLVEMVLDKAAQKGTGKWTSQAAMDFGVPIPTIDSAVSMRQISSQKDVRILIAKKFNSPPPVLEKQLAADGKTVTSEPQHDLKAELAKEDVKTVVSEQQNADLKVRTASDSERGVEGNDTESIRSKTGIDRVLDNGGSSNKRVREDFNAHFERSVEHLKNALLSSFIVTYAQGLSLLQTVSIEKNYGLNLAEIAKVWRGGCIIRSSLLEDMRRAFTEDPKLPNLILDDNFAEILNANRRDWRETVEQFTDSRVPVMCLSSALAYFDAFRSERLPANLIQAQRDYFGAHTYQRTDKEGIFHTPDWKE